MICEDFKRETEAIIGSGDFSDVSALTFPAVCYTSLKDKKIFTDLIPDGGNECGRSVILGGSCLKGHSILDKEAGRLLHYSPRKCFSMFMNEKLVDKYLKDKSYLMTPCFISEWRQRLKAMRLDQKSARSFFRKSANRLILLDTGIRKNMSKKLREVSAYVRMPAEILPVGLDHYRMFLKEIILDWRMRESQVIEEIVKDETIITAPSATSEQERRGHRRLSIEGTCLVEMNDSEMVRLKDASMGGMRLTCQRPLPPNSTHSVKIFPTISDEIHLTGIVAWSSAVKTDAGPNTFETGIKFAELSMNTAQALERFLNIPAV
ncbi:MAG: PilZ domain-containing protein [Nitrospirae bacterium]|nr:PilZ domain-containing protein [Nitrospirota bacterium]